MGVRTAFPRIHYRQGFKKQWLLIVRYGEATCALCRLDRAEQLSRISMKSSGAAVFTRHNPFPRDPPLPKSHYSPSRSRKIPKQQKRLTLSPVRFTQPPISSEPPPQAFSQKTEERVFHGRSHSVLLCPPTSTECQQSFSESWPSTDLSQSTVSSAASPRSEDQIYAMRNMTATVTSGPKEPSVLAKYIERFRFGKPQSREERQHEAADGEEDLPFWWMSTSPPSSLTATQTSERPTRETAELKSDRRSTHSFISKSPVRDTLNLSVLTLSELSLCDSEEPEILQLQERASRLLQRSEHSLSSASVPVSSEGLGCSDFSTPVSRDEPVRKPIVPILMGSTNLGLDPSLFEGTSFHTLAVGSVGSREDDILFQWRLRRKMEQARQSTHNSFLHVPLAHTTGSKQTHGSHFNDMPLQRSHLTFAPVTIASLDPPTPDPARPVSSASVSRLQPQATIKPQEQPDPHRKPTYQNKRVPKKTAAAPAPPQHHRQAGTQADIPETTEEQQSSSPSPQPNDRTEERWPDPERKTVTAVERKSERREKKIAPSNHRRKSERVERNSSPVRAGQARGHERVSRKARDMTGNSRWKEEGQRSTRVERPGDRAPLPIHNALGQVVSEVLFPSEDSLETQCRSSSASPTFPPPPPPQSSVAPPPDMQQPCEVIDQLMQDAEDSDGKEFEDDPLLQVLRQQRNWVKEQMCEVNMMLERFLPLTSPTGASNV